MRLRVYGAILAVCLGAGLTAHAQEKLAEPATVSAGAGTVTGESSAAEARMASGDKDAAGSDAADKDSTGKGPDSKEGRGGKGKKSKKKKKEKPPKLLPMSIVNGSLTMDGATGKAALNYDIEDLHYLYIWTPGIGTVVISNKQFPGAVEEKKAFSENAVDVTVEEHKLEIYSDQPLFDRKKTKEMARDVRLGAVSAWVRVDKEFTLPTPYPAMGFGMAAAAPYAWPGAKPGEKRERGVVTPPPLPEWMRPKLAPARAVVPAGSTESAEKSESAAPAKP